ncbi:MAG: hypothetical protein L6V88_10205 [Anaerotruncus sp.]|nr:MAG: hypothetical protein L6V88_10205 [Anaerotruncus sp.]
MPSLKTPLKSYYKDLYGIQFKSEDAITNSAYDKMLLADNLISDGPDFEKFTRRACNAASNAARLLCAIQRAYHGGKGKIIF